MSLARKPRWRGGRRTPVVSAALIAALLASLGLLYSPPVAQAGVGVNGQPSLSTQATAAPSTVAVGGTESITVSVYSATALSVSVDAEVYDPTGARVFEQAYDDWRFGAGQTRTFSFSWQVPAAATLGTYSVQVGVFSPDWGTQYVWNSRAGQFAVATIPTSPPASTAPPSQPAAPTATRPAAPTATRPPAATATRPPAATATRPAATPQATGGAMTGLHVQGNQILSGSGQVLQLRGVNRSSAEYACIGGYGVFEGPTDAVSVQAMLAWKINAVRVVLNEDCWLGINGVNAAYSGASYQDAVSRYVALLTSNNIAVILNLHFNAPGSQLATGQLPMADRDHSPSFWRSVAARFKDNSAVLFEPYNEPYPDGGRNTSAAWTCWRDGGSCPGVAYIAAGMQELVTAIRDTGATNIIIVTGNNYGSQLDRWLQYKPTDPLNQLAAGWHTYGDGLDCQTPDCWNSTLASILKQVPIVATEIGEFDCGHSYIDQVLSFLDSQRQSYMAWAWGPYDCAAEPALISDWSGTPTQTYGQGFKDHLLQAP